MLNQHRRDVLYGDMDESNDKRGWNYITKTLNLWNGFGLLYNTDN
jgi:hypothetical protein